MKTIGISEASTALPSYVQSLQGASAELVVITQDGKPVAALVGIDGIDLESVSLSTNAAFLDIIERSRARHREEGSMSSVEVRRQFPTRKR